MRYLMDSPDNVMAVLLRLQYAFDLHTKDNLHGHRLLMYSVVADSIQELDVPERRAGCIDYLSGEMMHAEACGVEPDWIRRILKDANVISFTRRK